MGEDMQSSLEIENIGMKEIPSIIEVDYFMNSVYNAHL